MEHNQPAYPPQGESAIPVRRMDWFAKVKAFWLPWLVLSVCSTLVLSLIHAFPVLRWHWVKGTSAIMQLWLPLIAAAAIMVGYLMPRIRRASIRQEPMRVVFLNMLGVALLALPMMMSQWAVREWFTRVERLPNPLVETGYREAYQFEELHVSADRDLYYPILVPSRDRKTDSVHLVVLTPLLARPLDTAQTVELQFVLYRTFTHHADSSLKGAALDEQLRPWIESIVTENQAHPHVKAAWYSPVTDRMAQVMAQQAIDSMHVAGKPMPLVAHAEPFSPARTESLGSWAIAFAASLAIWLVLLLTLRLKAKPDERPKGEGTGKGLLFIFLPRKGYLITPIVIALNLLFFVVCAIASKNPFQFDSDVLILLGGNKPSLTQGAGQYWRLVTSAFLHGGLMHFLANMYGMFIMGRLLEPLLRPTRFLLSYLLAALIGSITSLLFLEGDSVRIGASGALFGLMGMLVALTLTPLFPQQIRQPLMRSMATTLLINAFTSFLPMVDWAAHLGGLVCGAMLGFLWYPILKREKQAMIEKARANRP